MRSQEYCARGASRFPLLVAPDLACTFQRQEAKASPCLGRSFAHFSSSERIKLKKRHKSEKVLSWLEGSSISTAPTKQSPKSIYCQSLISPAWFCMSESFHIQDFRNRIHLISFSNTLRAQTTLFNSNAIVRIASLVPHCTFLSSFSDRFYESQMWMLRDGELNCFVFHRNTRNTCNNQHYPRKRSHCHIAKGPLTPRLEQ